MRISRREESMRKGLVVLSGVLLFLGSPAQAQRRDIEEADLPRWVAEEIINFFNDPSTIHFTGRSRIPSTRVILGDVAALGGPLIISGEVDGDLVVVNGDLIFEAGGVVTGDATVVGGRVLAEELGEIGGTLTVYEEPLRYTREGDRIEPAGRRRPRGSPFRSEFPFGDSRFVITAGQNYNRVEGLPVTFGPSIRTGGPNPLRLDLFGIWRTEMGVDLDNEDFGYDLRVEQALGSRNRISVGATAYSFVQPVEDWGLSNLEASLATFLLHKDYRDYYERTGWSAFARLRVPNLPVTLRAQFFEEEHEFAPVGGPWSLTDNDKPWRAQPMVAEGTFQSIEGTVVIDSRNYEGDPTDGWYIQARARRGLGGDLFLPAHLTSTDPDAATIPPEEFDNSFTTGFIDIRSYNRVGPNSSLNLRGVLGGALDDSALPPQFQRAFGGEGSLPGYRPFYGDCGARSDLRAREVSIDETRFRDPAYPAYGCDQIAVFQAEYRGRLSIGWDWGGGERGWEDDWDWYPTIDFDPSWAAFFNAGRGWTAAGLGDTETLADVGVGLYLGDLGLYWAYPLKKNQHGERNINFFIRLSRRF
jgi:hypothetical protein